MKKLFAKLFSSANAHKTPLEEGYIKESGFLTHYSFSFIANLIFVDVKIEGEVYKFLLDTAALGVISTRLVEKLSLRSLEAVEVYDSADTHRAKQLFTLPSLMFAEIEFCDFVVVAEDFSEDISFTSMGIDGILGYNFLASLSLSIDYKRQELQLSDRKIAANHYTKMPFVFDGKSGGKFEMNFAFRNILFTLDTGKNGGLSLCRGDDYGSMDEQGYQTRELYGEVMSSLYTRVETDEKIYLVKDFSIANSLKVAEYPVSLSDTKQNLVGNSFLKNFAIIVDFKRETLYLKPYKKEPLRKSFHDGFGFWMAWSASESLYISGLTKESVAEEMGLRVGDRVLSLGELDTFDLSREEYASLFLFGEQLSEYESQESLSLTLKRDTKIRRVLLKKADMCLKS